MTALNFSQAREVTRRSALAGATALFMAAAGIGTSAAPAFAGEQKQVATATTGEFGRDVRNDVRAIHTGIKQLSCINKATTESALKRCML